MYDSVPCRGDDVRAKSMEVWVQGEPLFLWIFVCCGVKVFLRKKLAFLTRKVFVLVALLTVSHCGEVLFQASSPDHASLLVMVLILKGMLFGPCNLILPSNNPAKRQCLPEVLLFHQVIIALDDQ